MSASHQDVSITSAKDAKAGGEGRVGWRKRRRDDGGGDGVEVELDRRSFTIKQSSSDPFGRPLTLTPLYLLPRANLPLAYLDTTQSIEHRFFSAHIHTLESSHSYGMDATVLLAQETDGRLFAVERVSYGRYAICRLRERVGSDELVNEKRLKEQVTVKKTKREDAEDINDPAKREAREWWKNAAVDMAHEQAMLDVGGSEVRSKSMLDMRPPSLPIAMTTNTTAPDNPDRAAPVEPKEPVESALPSVPQSAQDVLQELAKHYLEALYLSRTSLAYFTKGPLSRARAAAAAISEAEENGQPMISIVDLIDFLRQTILTSNVMDKKYKDGIADIVKELPVRDPSENTPKALKRKKKRKWKAKRGKGGLFVDEQDFVELWWRDDDPESSPSTENADVVMRKRIARIRNRETFLQIILALEVLALEASLSVEEKKRQDTTASALESQGAGETQQDETQATDAGESKTSRPKKKQDLPALLETLLDKLTIWFSLESHTPAKSRTTTGENDAEQQSENGELHDFCIEVVLPFYVSRIPRHANVVNKKLGGPTAPSPVKRKSSTKGTTSVARKPGEPAPRQPPPEKKPRQPLGRTASVTDKLVSKERHSLPSLQRSSTDSDALLTHIKREANESVPPIDSIPAAKVPVKPQQRSRAPLMNSLSRREVDFTAMSAASEAKMKKKADVEEKLREAISTLKKPNRAAAVKEVAESADASFAKALVKGKGGQQKVKATAAGAAGVAGTKEDKGWLVAATPSRHGKRVKGTPLHANQSDGDLGAALSSGSSALIPSTSARLQAEQNYADDPVPASTPAIPATGHRPCFNQSRPQQSRNAVEDTPSRGFARFMPAGLAREPGTLDSPIVPRKCAPAIENTPSKPVKFVSSTPAGTMSTPLTKAMSRPLVEASSNPRSWNGSFKSSLLAAQAGSDGERGQKEKSIYERLGWEEEEYEELA